MMLRLSELLETLESYLSDRQWPLGKMKEGFKDRQRLRASNVCACGGGIKANKTNKMKKATGTYLALTCFAIVPNTPMLILFHARLCFLRVSPPSLPTPITDVTLGFLCDL